MTKKQLLDWLECWGDDEVVFFTTPADWTSDGVHTWTATGMTSTPLMDEVDGQFDAQIINLERDALYQQLPAD